MESHNQKTNAWFLIVRFPSLSKGKWKADAHYKSVNIENLHTIFIYSCSRYFKNVTFDAEFQYQPEETPLKLDTNFQENLLTPKWI